jgi:dihydrofolate synthase/folylpolyglutamate synthase
VTHASLTEISNYSQAVEALRDLPDYEKLPSPEFRRHFFPDPTTAQRRMQAILDALGNPERKVGVAFIAGANGKGSIAVMTSSILTHAGGRPGLWTKPHLHSVRERISVANSAISEATFCQRLARVGRALAQAAGVLGSPKFSRYEVLFGLAMQHFAEEGVEIALLEADFGAVDLVAALCPVLVAFGPIVEEHAEVLGTSALEVCAKQGEFIRGGSVIVMGPQEPSVAAELERRALARAKRTLRVGRDLLLEAWPPSRELCPPFDLCYPNENLRPSDGISRHTLRLRLPGLYQPANAATAVATALALRAVSSEAIERGLLVRWIGRLEYLSGTPSVLLDGAHNVAGVEAVLASLCCFDYERLIVLVGISADKDCCGMLRRIADRADAIVVTQSSSPRARGARELMGDVGAFARPVLYSRSVEEGLERARELAHARDLVLVTGSLYTVMDARVSLGLAPHHESQW